MRRDPRWWLICAAMVVIASLAAAAYWPGLMTWDAVRQYREALHGRYDDWHPPAMDWLWRQFHPIAKGPAPMLVLQLALYWAGFTGLVVRAVRRGRRGLALALAMSAMLPIPLALLGAVLKDGLMAGALVAATALLAWTPERRGWALRVPALLLLIGAATLRFNALPACLPLMIALLPASWRRTPTRFSVAVLISAGLLAAALPLANRALHAEPSGVGLSLVIFDLAGITYHSGVDVFPDIDVEHRVAVNAKCYTPLFWDRYAWWSPEACPIQFTDIGDALADAHESPYSYWAKAIAAHPVAYAEHRFAHFNLNMRFLVHDEVEPAAQLQSAPNPWRYTVGPNPIRGAIELLALWSGRTPLGWPICWLALALGALIVGPGLPSRRIVVPLALSALLYGLGYLVVSVASELRYNLWTMVSAGIATSIAASSVMAGAAVSRRRVLCAVAPFIVVTALCILWRLT